MAISGSGTSSDPYIVHDWSELLEAFDGLSGSYIELASNIEAPDESVTVWATKNRSLDGKGFAINNLHHSGSNAAINFGASSGNISGDKYLKNIKFTNVYLTGGFCVWQRPSDGSGIIKNVSFSGRIDSGTLIKVSYAPMYGPWLNINGIAANIETGTGNCCILVNEWESTSTIPNGNIKVKYLNCSPQNPLAGTSSYKWSWSNTLFDITAEDTETKVNLGNNISNCAVIGKGSGVSYTSASGKNIVEDTLPVITVAGVVYSLTTAQMKDAQYLHDTVGFPIGVN